MSLIPITEKDYPVVLEIAYATSDNFTGKPVYKNPLCFIHQAAQGPFEKALDLAAQQNLKFKIFDAFRPQQAQEALWEFCPNPMYVMPPTKGSSHTRGIAIDLTLMDSSGQELDMGTPFDSFLELSHHGNPGVSKECAVNRYTLLGIMMSAGWDMYMNEWWHYQLFNAPSYPLILDDHGMMSDLKQRAVG